MKLKEAHARIVQLDQQLISLRAEYTTVHNNQKRTEQDNRDLHRAIAETTTKRDRVCDELKRAKDRAVMLHRGGNGDAKAMALELIVAVESAIQNLS